MTKMRHHLPLGNIFNRGYRDFFKGNLDNPFPERTMKGKEWQRGFNRGYFDNLKYITSRSDAKRQ